MSSITKCIFYFLRGVVLELLQRRPIKALLPLLTASTLAACSIHPVQQDVTGIPTKAIVDRIRCEARLAVLDKAIDVVRAAAERSRTSAPAIAERFDAIAVDLQGQRGHPIAFDPRRLPTDRAKLFYGRYINTVIAYDFLMEGTENNSVSLAADPFRLITNGSAGVTLGGSGALTRDNQRHFRLSDSFGELLYGNSLLCESLDYLPENYIYPVSGTVGLREVVGTFIDLNEDKQLSQFDQDKNVFADTLKFTTTWSGSATPHVQLDAVGTQFGLTGTNIGLSAMRSDIHTLTVGLAMGAPQIIPSVAAARQRLSSGSATQQSNTDAAFGAIDELRYRSFLDRAVVIVR